MWRVTSIQQYTLMFSDRWLKCLVNRSYFYPTSAWIPHEFLTSWFLALDLFISYSYFTDGAYSTARKRWVETFMPKILFIFLRYALICLLPYFWLLWLRDLEYFISYSYFTNGAFSNTKCGGGTRVSFIEFSHFKFWIVFSSNLSHAS